MRQTLIGVLQSWYDIFGDKQVTVSAVLKVAADANNEWAELLGTVCADRDGKLSGQKLGNYLTKHANRPEGGYQLRRVGRDRSNVALWCVIRAGSAGVAGTPPATSTNQE